MRIQYTLQILLLHKSSILVIYVYIHMYMYLLSHTIKNIPYHRLVKSVLKIIHLHQAKEGDLSIYLADDNTSST